MEKTVTGLTWFGGNLLSLFTDFTANKSVVIKDRRLAIIFRILQAAVAFYIFIDIFAKASYLTVEVPTGSVTVWHDWMSVDEKIGEFRTQRKAARNGTLVYCTDPDLYNFHLNGVQHENFSCGFMESANLFVKGESQAFVTTSMQVEKFHYYSRVGKDKCERMKGKRRLGKYENACAYYEQQYYFPIKPEDITLNFNHNYQTSLVINKKGALPQTIFKFPNFTTEDKKFEANEVPKLSLHQLLQFSGIDLDKRLNKQDNNPCNDTSQGNKTDGEIQYPYARLSGVTLQMTFNYYTKKLAPKPYRDLAGDDSEAIICIVEVVPHNRWSHLGTEIRHMMNKPSDPLFLTINGMGDGNYNQSEILTSQTNFQRQGVAFVFSTSGSIGRFAISSLMNALVAGSVLFAIAHWITTLIATYAMTLKSDAYKALMYQEVDWEQAYACYATHIIVAGFVFDQMDKNDNGKLEHKEIFNHLKKLLGFSDEENTNKNKNKNEIETEESIETGGEVKNINEEENKEGNNITYENKGEIKIEGKKENDNKNEIETEESIETNGEIQNVNEEENDNKNENNNVKNMNKKLDIENGS